MTFLQPLFFWASALIIPLAAIYFLKVRPRRDTTTAIFLWRQIYKQKQASSLLNRLRDLLSLLLLVCAFLLLTFAMAKPQFVSRDGNDILILIDNSASMAAQSKGQSKTRLQQACKLAKEIVTGMGAGKRAAIATVADQIDYQSYLTDNSKQLVRAIDAIDQTEIPFSVDALEKASAGLGNQKSSRVILISDAAAFTAGTIVNGKPLADPSAEKEDTKPQPAPEDSNTPSSAEKTEKDNKPDRQLPGGIELVKIDSPAENIGIVSCDLQQVVTETGRMSFYCRLANSGEKTVEADLLLYILDDTDQAKQARRFEKETFDELPARLIKAMPATIAPGLNDPMFFQLTEDMPGRYIVLLDYEDASAADNIAYLTIPPADPIRIGVLNKDRYFFEHCIQAFSQSTGLIELTELSVNEELLTTEIFLAEGNLVPEKVYDPNNNSVKRKFSAIIFNPNGESDCWHLTGNALDADQIIPRITEKNHPAVRYYDPTVIPFYGAKEVTVPSGAQTLLETDTGVPLIWRINKPDRDVMVVNIDPSQGQFYYSPFFPVMVYRMSLALAGREKISVATCSTNDLLPEHIRKTLDPISITSPVAPASEPANPADLPPLTAAGYYTLEQLGQSKEISCSLLNAKETLVNDSVLKSDAAPIRKGRSPSYWLTLLALAIVAAESILYHRRKVG